MKCVDTSVLSDLLRKDKKYVIKKFGITESDFEDIMSLEPKIFLDFKNNYFLISLVKKLMNFLRGKGLLPK